MSRSPWSTINGRAHRVTELEYLTRDCPVGAAPGDLVLEFEVETAGHRGRVGIAQVLTAQTLRSVPATYGRALAAMVEKLDRNPDGVA